MNYERLLNKEDCRSYSLLKYLENCFTLSESLSKIQTNFGFSSYILRKTIKKLKDDMGKHGLSQSISITEKEVRLSIHDGGKYTSRRLLMYYLQDSLSLKMVTSFYTGVFRSIESFSEDHFISYSVGYNTLQILKDTLKPYDIYFEKRKIIGDKNNIRSFLTSFFSLANITFSQVYQYSILIQTDQLVKSLETRYSLSSLEKKKLFHYIAIYLELRSGPTKDGQGEHFFTTQCVENLKQLLAVNEDSLTLQIISWLFVNHKLEETYLQKIEKDAANKITTNFIKKFENYFPNVDPCCIRKLVCELNLLHYNALYKKIDIFEKFTEKLLFLKESYPDYYGFLLNYFEQVNNKQDVKQAKEYLFFNYLVILINNFSISLLSDKVKVMFDFSMGAQYNLFLQNVLFMNDKLNVAFTDRTQDADIIITDVNELYSDEKSSVLVWSNPPKFIDWMHLARLLAHPFGSETQDKQMSNYLLSEIIKRCVKSLEYPRILNRK